MTVRRIFERQAKYQSETMDSSTDKEERKREYNRLAQREFRRRRKEHLKSLEEAQKAQSSEQHEEIERLRLVNAELKRENEALRTQIYGPSSSTGSHLLMPSPMTAQQQQTSRGISRAYSLSPSVTSTADAMSNPGTPPTGLVREVMTGSSLGHHMGLTSSIMLPAMPAYADPSNAMSGLPSHPYAMVDASGIHHSTQGSPDLSGFSQPRPAVGGSIRPMSLQAGAESASQGAQNRPTRPKSSILMVPYDRNRGRHETQLLFAPLLNDPSILTDSNKHLSTLQSMSDHLPPALKPTQLQISTPHYYGIDVVPSTSLREQLLTLDGSTARSFVEDLGIIGDSYNDLNQLVIWGSDPFDESTWELSQGFIDRWSWLLGREWITRANFWRKQRGASLLPEW